jgi:hypothetical protein
MPQKFGVMLWNYLVHKIDVEDNSKVVWPSQKTWTLEWDWDSNSLRVSMTYWDQFSMVILLNLVNCLKFFVLSRVIQILDQ